MQGFDLQSLADAIPEAEIELFRRQIITHPEYCDPGYVAGAYKGTGLKVLSDPFSIEVLEPVIEALQKNKPFSVIRMGDGEINVLSHDVYVGTPNLDRYAFLASIALMEDKFIVTEIWMSVLRDLMVASIREADMIGCRGLSRLVQWFSTDRFINTLTTDLRGGVGVFRAIDLMLHLAYRKILRGKIICSPHLYLSVLDHLDILFHHTENVLCISKKRLAIEKLKRKYPETRIDHIPVGMNSDSSPRTEPTFLREIEVSLPKNLQGTLCLVGAGIWAEIYCTWIKQRGGVGIDIGSGFDLMAGKTTRPAHKEALGESVKKYL